jgi:hypothetical protein
MRIFGTKSASTKSTSIVAIKRKNKQFADWWNRWASRIERTHLLARKKDPGTDGQNQAQEAETFRLRNALRLRKILEERER